MISDFEAGLLPLENGATLRAFLSKKLNCDPMRISKKFAGAKCLGKVGSGSGLWVRRQWALGTVRSANASQPPA